MGILQARTLEWVAMPSSRGPSQPSDRTQAFLIADHGEKGGFGLEKVLSVRVRSMDAHGLDRGGVCIGGRACGQQGLHGDRLAGRRGAGPSLDRVASCQCASGLLLLQDPVLWKVLAQHIRISDPLPPATQGQASLQYESPMVPSASCWTCKGHPVPGGPFSSSNASLVCVSTSLTVCSSPTRV